MSADELALWGEWDDALNRWDTDWVLAHVTEDVHWEPLRAQTEGVFHGREGVRRFITDTEESFEFIRGQITEVRDLHDGRVLALGTLRVKGKASGIETVVPTAIIATFQDGLLVSFVDYGDREKALEAAGLG
jgi:ketosteroid isomerase-like protein